MAEKVLAAVIQMGSGNNREANLLTAGRLMERAVDRGAGLLVLPENFSFMGASEEERRDNAEIVGQSPSLDFIQTFADRHNVWVVGGSISLVAQESDKIANACVLVGDDGVIRARYDKVHLFDADLGSGYAFRESDVVRPGVEAVVAETPFGRLGLAIGYDIRFPEYFRRLVEEGAEILAIPSSFTMLTGREHWEVLVRARAIENFSVVLAANQKGLHPSQGLGGPTGVKASCGHSMIVGPWGTVLVQCSSMEEGFALTELDPARVASARSRIPCLQNRRF